MKIKKLITTAEEKFKQLHLENKLVVKTNLNLTTKLKIIEQKQNKTSFD